MDRRDVQTDAGALFFGRGEETGRFNGVRQKYGRRDADEKGEDAFNDEYPLLWLSVVRQRKARRLSLTLQPSRPLAGPIALRPRARRPPNAPDRDAAV